MMDEIYWLQQNLKFTQYSYSHFFNNLMKMENKFLVSIGMTYTSQLLKEIENFYHKGMPLSKM